MAETIIHIIFIIIGFAMIFFDEDHETGMCGLGWLMATILLIAIRWLMGLLT